jgi:tRNA (cmo5U34)-methyltransferase
VSQLQRILCVSSARRAGRRSRIALAGYDAGHKLTVCLLSASLGHGSAAKISVIGAGGSRLEVLTAGRLERNWHFTAVDPPPSTLRLAEEAVRAVGLSATTSFHLGTAQDVPTDAPFDAPTSIGVLHHLQRRAAKQAVLAAIAERLNPSAPFVLAGSRGAYARNVRLLPAWHTRWRMAGATDEEIETKIGKYYRELIRLTAIGMSRQCSRKPRSAPRSCSSLVCCGAVG